MKNINPKTPTQANYRILDLIQQMVAVAAKGTALGLCDLVSAMLSGYFIESGGAVTPAIEAFLQREVKDEKEREARTRRGAKALTYGSYNMKELMDKLRCIVEEEGQWQPTVIQEYRIAAVDFTAYRRAAVKKLEAKAYVADADKAVSAVPMGMIASIGQVKEQRIALLKNVVMADLRVNDGSGHKKQLYKQVARELAEDELSVWDAGFGLVEAVAANIRRCLIRLSKNVTFGKTAGQIPERTSIKGPEPTQYKAEIVRPLARTHGDKTLPATAADEIYTRIDEIGREIEIHVWHKLYFLERQLKKVTDLPKKKKLRHTPIKVMAIYDPDYDDPLLLGTPLLDLTPESASKVYVARWPIEGLPQTGKYILSGGGGTHYVHHPTAMQRLPLLSLIFGSLLKYAAATLPPFRTGFWDRAAKPTYGRLLRHLKKVGIQLSGQLFKKRSVTAHLPVGYEAISLAKP
ncbi:MAG: hypothetical protein GY927_08150 [bacterium]|nr:hypothetical protein [bacterium]